MNKFENQTIDDEVVKNGYAFRVVIGKENRSYQEHFYDTIVFLISGECYFSSGGKKSTLSEFEYGLIKSGIRHEIDIESPDCVIVKVFIVQEEMHKILEVFGQTAMDYYNKLNEPIFVSGDYNVKLKVDEIYGRILKYGDDDGLLRRLLAMEIITGILRKMHRSINSDEIPDNFVQAMYEMRKLDNLRNGVPAMEKLTGYSRPQLCRLIRRYYGKTPNEYLGELRMNFAYNLIKYSNTDIPSISESVGYSSLGHFYKKFGEYFGISPIEARNKEGMKTQLTAEKLTEI